jgi:capsular exopolysaccharide synthesis family protein
MSRIQRAVEKAEREGLLTWTHAGDDESRRATALDEPPSGDRLDGGVPLTAVPPSWETFSGPDAVLHPLFVAGSDPGSPAAEQYRLLRTRLEGRENSARTKLLVVTSPGAGEGKTTTSANLALTMAQEFQHQVVLVEADLRRPTLATLFGVRSEPGLIDVLLGASTLEDALVAVPGHQLFVLPAGAAAVRSAELLASAAMRRVVDTLRARFDRIVVDTPPVTLADTHVLARIADGVLVVVRAGVTPRPAVERALAGLDRQRLLGIILNEVDQKAEEYYGYAAAAVPGGSGE